ncbi:exo-alpha-sialidase [Streptomyces sp. NBC_00328]|uniref:exo-alpha-sialidase n=1 Tax=Streptomyces sp. NBC_00328 TaxID=2903646 RepID=UPI002E2AF4F8|nr:exo-alpha-sialidase [Streptomyces sp. NBC_00328]
MAVVTRRRAWPVLLTVVVAVLTGLLMPRSASVEGISGESTVYTNLASKGDGTRTPDIISTSANNAVVVWREGLRPGNVDMGYMRYSYTTDGGATWSPFETDTDLPSSNIARSYFTTDDNGRYLYIYNAGTDSDNRDILNYKTKRPGAAWSAAKLFANGPASDNTKQDDGMGGTTTPWPTSTPRGSSGASGSSTPPASR